MGLPETTILTLTITRLCSRGHNQGPLSADMNTVQQDTRLVIQSLTKFTTKRRCGTENDEQSSAQQVLND
jgi:hypothetical protein